MALVIVVTALLGLVIGSFLNVVIHRVPLHESLSHPPSRCPSCERPIRHRHNIPVLGWLLLQGRCADCGTAISCQYPLIELITAVLFVSVTVRLAHLHLLAALPAYLYFTSIGICLSMIDLHVRRLPNAIVYPAYLVLALLLSAAAVTGGDWRALVRGGIGGAGLFAIFLVLALVHPAGMGLGDVKLAGIIGAVLGFLSYPSLIVGALAAFVLGSVVGVVAIWRGVATGKNAIPFGPFMVTGALLALFAAGPVSGFYSRVLLHT